MFLRAGTTGLLFILLGSLLFAANIFVMMFKWKIALLKVACSPPSRRRWQSWPDSLRR